MSNIEDFYPLSPLQEGMLFHTLCARRSGVYITQLSCRIAGGLDVPAFERAWQEVMDRHSVLRTFFIWEDLKDLIQIVQRRVNLPVISHDWSDLSPLEQESRFEEHRLAERANSFDPSSAPLMRLTLLKLGNDLHRLLWSFHHLLLDGWSAAIILREVGAFYEAFSQGRVLQLPRPRPYRDYIAWLYRQDLSEAETFWREELKGFKSPTPLPFDLPAGNASEQAGEFRYKQIEVSTPVTTELQTLARRHGLTLNTLVQGAWGVILSHQGKQPEVVFGTAVAGRPAELPDVQSIAGMFINTLPVRVRMSPEQPLFSWLAQLQSRQAQARQYEYTPLVKIQSWSEIPRGATLLESHLSFDNFPMDVHFNQPSQSKSDQSSRGGLGLQDISSFAQSNLPLTLLAAPGRELILRIRYDGLRFYPDTIARLLKYLETVLNRMVAPSQSKVKELLACLDQLDARQRVEKEKEYESACLNKLRGLRRRRNSR